MGNPVRQEDFGKDLGLVHEAVVTGRKVGAGPEFWSALAHDEGLFRKVVGIVLPQVFEFTEPEQLAVSILGVKNVFGIKAVMNVWDNHPLPETMPTVTFSEEILRQCAKENKRGADWHLVWINGFSLRQQEQIRGRNRKKQPCFYLNLTWWLESAQDPWATRSIGSGYRLLDFNGRFAGIAWQCQEEEISKLGESFERAEEQAVAEACLSIFMITKKRLLQDWCHWGRLLTAGSHRVAVGSFDGNGFCVGSYWDGSLLSRLRTVLSRKS